MALKDWKKIRGMKWQQKIRGNIQDAIYIDRRKVPLSYFGTKEELQYGVHIGYNVIDKKSFVTNRSEYFKTKVEAIKYAQKYMEHLCNEIDSNY